MAENWCEAHQTDWFKTDKMKSYAHPLKDAGGKTVGWCNKPKDEPESVTKGDPPKKEWKPMRDDDRTDQRAAAMEIGQDFRAGLIKPDSTLVKARDTWLRHVLTDCIDITKHIEKVMEAANETTKTTKDNPPAPIQDNEATRQATALGIDDVTDMATLYAWLRVKRNKPNASDSIVDNWMRDVCAKYKVEFPTDETANLFAQALVEIGEVS